MSHGYRPHIREGEKMAVPFMNTTNPTVPTLYY